VPSVLAVITSAAILWTTQSPVLDGDVYWHILAGSELASGSTPSAIGEDWSFAPDPQPWVSTQWLAELGLWHLYSAVGWAAILAFRVVTCAIAIGVLTWTTLRGRSTMLAAWPFLVAMLAACAASQERPQQLTLIGAAILGGVLEKGLTQGGIPRWYSVVPPTILWANAHGGWVLVPTTIALVGVSRIFEHGVLDKVAHRALALGVALAACGAASPSGVDNIVAVARFSAATERVKEWQPTTPLSGMGIFTLLMLLGILAAWARPVGVPRSEMLATVALVAFTWVAVRNVAPGLLLIAPLVAHRMDRSFRTTGELTWMPSRLAMGGVVGILALGAAAVATSSPLQGVRLPVTLAQRVADLPPGQRVLNDYNVAGVVLHFGGEATQVAIDGRADRYGAEYIRSYLDLVSMRGHWNLLLRELDPTSALLAEDSPLVHVLTGGWGWEQLGTEGRYVLLAPDSASE
jgi:hypothetical protein